MAARPSAQKYTAKPQRLVVHDRLRAAGRCQSAARFTRTVCDLDQLAGQVAKLHLAFSRRFHDKAGVLLVEMLDEHNFAALWDLIIHPLQPGCQELGREGGRERDREREGGYQSESPPGYSGMNHAKHVHVIDALPPDSQELGREGGKERDREREGGQGVFRRPPRPDRRRSVLYPATATHRSRTC